MIQHVPQGLLVNRNNHAGAAGLGPPGSLPANAAVGLAATRPACAGLLQLGDVWSARRAPLLAIAATVAAILILGPGRVEGAEPKRVLLIHSFGSAAPPFTVESTAFETELAEKMGARVDLDEVSLDMARYADPDTQEAIVNYLQKRQSKWQPDLVVPIGAPAAIFVAKNRDRLFPETPIVYASADRRLLPTDALEKNAAYIGQVYDIPGMLEDMLQLAPATQNIVVIVGATPLEHLWQEVFQKAAEPLTKQINFTYYSDLSFDQMLQRVAKLPPNSYIFVLLLLRDSSGVTHNGDEALQRLHQVANAPINAIFNHQLGLGIVGGRLYRADRVGKAAAGIAIRILGGEPASSFPPTMIDRMPPRYDSRELKRWNISENLLPPGSTILFREPTVWGRYQSWIIAGISIFILQALLITGLLANLVKRHRVERALKQAEVEARQHLEQISLLGRVSLLGEMAASLAHELGQPLAAITTNANAGMRFIEKDMADPVMLQEILADVVSDAHRAHDIIQNVRNTIKKGDSTRRRIDLNDLVTKVAHVVRPDAVGYSCELETLLADDLPSIEGDPVQIQQVLVNLVSNAFDSMRLTPPSRRRVEIRTKGNGNNDVELSVRDHGTGISHEAQRRLFDRFFTTKEKGLGMGLAIVRSIVEAHGGKIEAENADDGGARFCLTLPVAKAES
ncbi:MAG: hypothetical protein DMF06_03645 [Verrucomicrobia bacterium]|nr:MAG: hypothetical protein DMF06_03645 [Verrucomicrobiota bacterium]